ncbi:MAG: hypothetical protein VX910_08460 [Candidatus Latescibacterota bacterium]|nr:hypothetical protein [Candidatus Latescibacterota bacterium]
MIFASEDASSTAVAVQITNIVMASKLANCNAGSRMTRVLGLRPTGLGIDGEII